MRDKYQLDNCKKQHGQAEGKGVGPAQAAVAEAGAACGDWRNQLILRARYSPC